MIEEKEEEFFLFANPDEEYELMRIFLGNKIPSDWGKMNQDTKRRYITQFCSTSPLMIISISIWKSIIGIPLRKAVC